MILGAWLVSEQESVLRVPVGTCGRTKLASQSKTASILVRSSKTANAKNVNFPALNVQPQDVKSAR